LEHGFKHTGITEILRTNIFFFKKRKLWQRIKWRILWQSRQCNWQILHQQQQTGCELQQQKYDLESTQLKTKVQHIAKNRKPRLTMMWIGLVVALGLACWLIRKWRFA